MITGAQETAVEHSAEDTYQFLERRDDSQRNELFVKGRKLAASHLVRAIRANKLSTEEAAEAHSIPREAVREAVLYADRHPDLIAQELEQDREAAERMATYSGSTPVSR